MARHKIRHFGKGAFVYFEGEPTAFLKPGSYRLDGSGYWVSRDHLRASQREKNRKDRAERRAQREARRLAEGILFGVGSGREGGGRGVAHKLHHLKYVNRDTTGKECPICFHRRLWHLWLSTDHARWTDIWEGWAETELVRRELLRTGQKMAPLMRDPGKWALLKEELIKEDLLKGSPIIGKLKHDLRMADKVFDAYMRKHKFEHKDDFCIFLSLGLTFEYKGTATHEEAISTEFHTDEGKDSTDDISRNDVLMHGEGFSTDFHID